MVFLFGLCGLQINGTSTKMVLQNGGSALYRNLQELVARDVPVAPIFNDVSLYAVRKEVKVLRMDPFFKPTLEKAWLCE
jgi:ABC-type oligopeptide transport system substrate-binding subunit